MTRLFDLSGKTAVVTGARKGIGFAFATALAEAGANIVAASAQQSPEGGEIGDAVRALGRDFRGVAVDLGDTSAVREFGEEVGYADILVNNAGMIRRAPAAEHPTEWWDEVLQINLNAHFHLAQTVGRQMVARGDGRIIFTASLMSFHGGIHIPGYAAAKSGIVGLVNALSNEWAASGVTVNAIAPGYIVTDNTRAIRDDPEYSRSILDRIPAGRWGTPEDLGGAAVFLASPAAAYVSGAVIPVDGGWLAR